MSENPTTIVVLSQRLLSFDYSTTPVVGFDMPKVVTKQAKVPNVELTPFNMRVIEAMKHRYGGDNDGAQSELAAEIGRPPDIIHKLTKRRANGSTFVVQIASACKVSPYWLATGQGEMLSPTGIADDALVIGLAWSHLKHESSKARFAKDLLEVALPFIPPNHPSFKHAEKLFRAAKRSGKIADELTAKAQS